MARDMSGLSVKRTFRITNREAFSEKGGICTSIGQNGKLNLATAILVVARAAQLPKVAL